MMRTSWLGVLTGAVMMTATSWSQTSSVPAAEQKGYAAITEKDLRTDLAYVASDKLKGRMSLQPGDDEATQWIAREFQKAGLKPITNT